MNKSELKIKLIHQIDSLDEERVIELYGIVRNFINGDDDTENWDSLTTAQKKGLEYGVAELEKGDVVEHSVVMEGIEKKVWNLLKA